MPSAGAHDRTPRGATTVEAGPREARPGAGRRSGESEHLDAREVAAFIDHLFVRTGIDFGHYARRSLERRLAHVMQQDGVATLSELRRRVADEDAALKLAQRLCVRVTSMFRDPAFWAALRSRVLPQLKHLPLVRIWDAGCSTGEEAYSLAILLGEEGLRHRARIYATDLDDSALERARAGVYPLERMREYTRNYVRAGGAAAFSEYYLASSDGVVMRGGLRSNVVFSRHNLATDTSFNEFHVVLCRNVLIYFDSSLQRRAHDLLWSSLATRGILGLGRREIVPEPLQRGRYEVIDAAQKLYGRVA